METKIEPRNMDNTGITNIGKTKNQYKLVLNRRLKRGAEKVVIQNKATERTKKSFSKKPVPRSKRIAIKLASKPRGSGMPIVNPQRQAEKQTMRALGLKNRKQLRKHKKAQRSK